MWDDRFTFVKMPEYNAFYDPHCINFISSIKRNNSTSHKRILSPIRNCKVQARLSPGKVRTKKATNGSSLKTLKVSKRDVIVLKQAVEDLWTKHNFPSNHQTSFRKLISRLNFYKAAVAIVNEIESIEKNTEPYQQLKKAAERRNDLLNKVQNIESKNEAISYLQELRTETCEVINRLKAWRTKLDDHTLTFEYNKENYVITIHNDYFRLIQSQLANWFSFEKSKVDALLLSPKVIEINSIYFKYHPIAITNTTQDNTLRVPLSKDLLHKFVSTQKYFENELKILQSNKGNKPISNPMIQDSHN